MFGLIDKVADAIFPVERPSWVTPEYYEWGARQKRRGLRLMLVGFVVALVLWLLGTPFAIVGGLIFAIGFFWLYIGMYTQYPTPPG